MCGTFQKRVHIFVLRVPRGDVIALIRFSRGETGTSELRQTGRRWISSTLRFTRRSRSRARRGGPPLNAGFRERELHASLPVVYGLHLLTSAQQHTHVRDSRTAAAEPLMGESRPTRTTAPGVEHDEADTLVVAAVACRRACGKRTDIRPKKMWSILPASLHIRVGRTPSPRSGQRPSPEKSSQALPQGDRKAGRKAGVCAVQPKSSSSLTMSLPVSVPLRTATSSRTPGQLIVFWKSLVSRWDGAGETAERGVRSTRRG